VHLSEVRQVRVDITVNEQVAGAFLIDTKQNFNRQMEQQQMALYLDIKDFPTSSIGQNSYCRDFSLILHFSEIRAT
jgi:hypothetical protein